MKIVKRTDIIKLDDNLKMTVSEAISNLSKLPISFIEKNYVNKDKKLAIKYYREMLKALMADQVAYFQIMESTLANHMSYRLNYYQDFSVFQLENLLPKFANEENNLINEFYEDVWLVLLQVSNQLDISDEMLKTWIIESKDLKPVVHNLDEYINVLHLVFKDSEQMISGLTINQFKIIVEESATDKEIREFANKFNINLPKSLQKHQVHDIILNGLNDKYPKKLEDNLRRLKDLTLIKLKRVAKDENLDVSYEINKKGSIERLLEEYPFANFNVASKENINLPPRVRVNGSGYVSEKVVTNKEQANNIKPQVVYANSNEPSQVVYTHNGEPIHIHVYYDGVLGQARDNNKDQEPSFNDIKTWPLWLKILIFVLILLIATFILVIFLDVTTIFPHEQSGFTKFIFDLLFIKK